MNYENQRLASVNETHEIKIKEQEKYIEELDKELNRIKTRPPLEIGDYMFPLLKRQLFSVQCMLTVWFTEREMRELLELNQNDYQDKTDELEAQLDKQKEGLQLTISSLEMQLAEANTQLAEAPAAGPATIDGYPAYFKNIAIPAPSLDNVVEEVMKVRLPNCSVVMIIISVDTVIGIYSVSK